MRKHLGVAVALLIGLSMHEHGGSPVWAQTPRATSTVVVELFTSEGCSSCPPADQLLSVLVQRQPLRNIEVLALGEHVDYFDWLGWRDPFSSSAFTLRQSAYSAAVFHGKETYTPQLVIDGRLETVGSDAEAVQLAIEEAARTPKAVVGMTAQRLADRRELRVEVHVEVPPTLSIQYPADVLLAVTEDNLTTDVRRGENGGRTLNHSAVVRRLLTLGTLPLATRTWSKAASVPLASPWKPEHLRLIALMQEHQRRRIVGAAAVSIAGVY